MCGWIWQSGPLAQGDDVGEWVNLLIIVVMAVFWLIGGLAKSLTNNKKLQQQTGRGVRKGGAKAKPPARPAGRETWLQHLARKAEEIQKAAGEQLAQQRQSQVPKRPGAPRRPAVPPASAAASISAPAIAKPSPVAPAKTEHPGAKNRRVQYQRHPLIDLDEPDALRKAILHYEILGKPLSLRDPMDSTSAF